MRNPDEKRKTVEDSVGFRLVWHVTDYWADVAAYSHFLELVDGYRESGRDRWETQT